jgi:hypothetical protein
MGGEDGGDGRVRGGGNPYLRRPAAMRSVQTGGAPFDSRRRRRVAGNPSRKCAWASNGSQLSAASRGPWAGGFLPKRFAQKSREKLGVWFELQLLAARSHPEAEPNTHYISSTIIMLLVISFPRPAMLLLFPILYENIYFKVGVSFFTVLIRFHPRLISRLLLFYMKLE